MHRCVLLKRIPLCCGVLALLLAVPPGHATPADSDASLWLPIHLDVPLTPKWTFETEPQSRWNENFSYEGQQQWRSAVTYQFTEKLSGSVGHMWTARQVKGSALFGNETTYENRIFQDVRYKQNPVGRVGIDHRLRLEERLFADVEDPLWYLRYRVRFSVPVGKTKRTKLMQSNEALVHLNSVGPIPSGLVQQRYFFGMNQQVSKAVDVDAGYQLVLSDQFGKPRNGINHVLLLQVNIRPTPKWEKDTEHQAEATPPDIRSENPSLPTVLP